MTLSINVSPEAESKLRERAAAAGQPVSEYAGHLVEQAVSSPSFDEILAPVRAEFAASGMTEDELGDLLEAAKHEMRRSRRGGGQK